MGGRAWDAELEPSCDLDPVSKNQGRKPACPRSLFRKTCYVMKIRSRIKAYSRNTPRIGNQTTRTLAIFLLIVATQLSPLASSHAAGAERQLRPNIIFIMADDMGYADVGAFGSEMINTPNIDQLARQGTLYTQFYAGASVCAPSREVLMTGLHTGHTVFRSNTPKVGGKTEAFGEGTRRISLTGEETTIAAVLKEAGYTTGITGKWGIAEPNSEATPMKMGFDEWLGYLNQNHANYYYPDYLWRNNARMAIPENTHAYSYDILADLAPDFVLDLVDEYWAAPRTEDKRIYSNDLMRDFALDFIRDNHASPFFLYFAATIPHKLMEVPSLGEYSEKDWPRDAKNYAAMVSRLDGYVGEIVEELDRLGIAENTLIIFTSDNGPVENEVSTFFHSAGRLRGTKGTLYEGGLKVPMIIKWPNAVPAGAVSNVPWMFVDVFPSLVEMAGAAYSGQLDGLSLLPTILGQDQDLSDRFLYWEFPRKRLWQAGRLGKWKGVREGTDQPLELYNLEKDPNETTNVADSHPGIVKEIEKRLSEEHVPSPYWPQN